MVVPNRFLIGASYAPLHFLTERSIMIVVTMFVFASAIICVQWYVDYTLNKESDDE